MSHDIFLRQLLESCAHYSLTPPEQSQLKSEGIEAFIFAKLTSKKFRKWSLAPEVETKVKQSIAGAVAASTPLQVRMAFGGYKLWRLPSAPQVDWAEFFAVSYYSQYLAPIMAAYPPGVNLVFASDDIVAERMNNIPLADTSSYFASFQALLLQFRVHFPDNFSIAIQRIADLYPNKEAFTRSLDLLVAQTAKEFAQLPPETLQAYRNTSELNMQLRGARDLSDLTRAERLRVIDNGFIVHEAYRQLPKREAFSKGPGKIAISPGNSGKAIALGSTKGSVVKFWTGAGILRQSDTGFVPQIFSPQQMNGLQKDKLRQASSNILTGRNFQTIGLLA